MKYLLDTPLLAELVRARPDDWVSRWMDAYDDEEIYLSLLTIGEIVKSIESESEPERRAELHRWLEEDLMVRFHGRIIPINQQVILEWGRMSAEAEARGKPLSAMDGMIAATVRAHQLVLITYNREIFAEAGIEVSDPWRG